MDEEDCEACPSEEPESYQEGTLSPEAIAEGAHCQEQAGEDE